MSNELYLRFVTVICAITLVCAAVGLIVFVMQLFEIRLP